MSNRIAASRAADRIATIEWMPQATGRSTWGAIARGWLRQAAAERDAATLPARIRQDLGLAGVVAASAGLLDVEARRLGF